MRYERGRSWVEIVGAAELSMRELDSLYTGTRDDAFKVIQAVVVAGEFWRKGAAHDLSDLADAMSLKLYDWLRETIFAAARDEVVDPEV